MPEITIKIGQRPYTVNCPAGEELQLEKARAALDAEASTLPQQIHLDRNGIRCQLHPPQAERFQVIQLFVKDHVLNITNKGQLFKIAQAFWTFVALPKLR